ncbi:NADH-quinone oxidoreductase subunit F [Enterococcus haemoperoxidus ATCC BAA-382]|uniref:NADH-quinone oxidoreductase subunit F n=1 Tax=Enterococcus haemoperoxidus ATCC BAA-382 TaxID=1158608 RepID=R2SI90_9ENTE|nr:NADH-ubiquinone oxidoreductase-F iron-sulfur binding region domain-containing protein [Enterococcus haemoperoxidus]EOH92576.1 NADH-quinone oxidoreductase subunit F [Enterococcus haemoperoxidus ATCC BAA-382]EOT61675.1 NADH-quinone oxidoreductase subunit F [Enterococcus haemoperoxidus ATCC BAA-382]OJG55512.1 NADH-quinone oxidoreductase subunit F [Enterococcus haemoperoxidus]
MIERNKPVLLARINKMKQVTDVEEYQKYNGFSGLLEAIKMEKERILDELDLAHLRGRGGAAFPLGKKWRHLYGAKGDTKYIVCNADEGEPGTFKDKALLEQDPLSVIEGMVIAGYLFSAKAGYIYIRGEYRRIQKIFQEALDNAEKAGFLGENIVGIQGFNYTITIISGAGAYVCGENSALLNSIEGKTGRPRVKPPHLADVGLYLQPTLVNNVESFASIPVILREGGQAYRDLGTEDGGGTKLICLSGHVKNRGLYEVNLGTPLQEILYSEEYGGGTATGRPLKFIHFGGQSGPIGAVENLDDCIYSYEGLWDNDLSIGSGAIVVMDDQVSIVDYLVNVAAFFAHESCGKCTPCRLGTTRILELLTKFNTQTAVSGDLERLRKMLTHVTNLSACGLGQSVANPMRSGLTYFPKEFEAGIREAVAPIKGGFW